MHEPGDLTINGNLATWDTGLTNYVYLPSHPKGHPIDLNGTYTVRVVVEDQNGETAEDRVTVTVANVIPNAWGGLVKSKDQRVSLNVPEQAIMDSFRLISIQQTKDKEVTQGISHPVIGDIYEVREAGEQFTKETTLTIVYDKETLNAKDTSYLNIFGYNKKKKSWELLPSTKHEGKEVISARIRKLHSYYALMVSDTESKIAMTKQPDKASEEPSIASSLGAYFFVRDSFEESLGEWSNRNNEVGASVVLDSKATFDGTQALKITNINAGGNFAVNAIKRSFDARQYPDR